MRKSILAEPIYQFTRESVLEGRIGLAMDAFLLSCLHKTYQSYFALLQETGFSSVKLQRSIEMFVNSFSCSEKGWAFMCMEKHYGTGSAVSRSEEATSGFKNDF